MSQIEQYRAAAIERTGLDDFGRDDYLGRIARFRGWVFRGPQ